MRPGSGLSRPHKKQPWLGRQSQGDRPTHGPPNRRRKGRGSVAAGTEIRRRSRSEVDFARPPASPRPSAPSTPSNATWSALLVSLKALAGIHGMREGSGAARDAGGAASPGVATPVTPRAPRLASLRSGRLWEGSPVQPGKTGKSSCRNGGGGRERRPPLAGGGSPQEGHWPGLRPLCWSPSAGASAGQASAFGSSEGLQPPWRGRPKALLRKPR